MAQLSQYTETNLVGQLTAPITEVATTITARFRDRISGDARAPQGTTRLYVIDKGSPSNPNPNYELIYTADVPSTTNDITTLTNCERGLLFYGTSLTGGTGNLHIANAEIGTVDMHYLWNLLTEDVANIFDGSANVAMAVYATEAARDIALPTPTAGQFCAVTGTKTMYVYINGKWYGSFIPTYANAAARDAAITSPVNGMKIYNTADGVFQGYVAGSWTDEGTSTTPNMSLTVAGKAEEATAAEIIANTQTGATGAELAVNPKYLSDASVITGAGAGDSGKYVRANSSGVVDSTVLSATPTYTTVTSGLYYRSGTAGEILAAGDWVYLKASDAKIYKATNTSAETANVIGVIITGGAANATIVYQFDGIWTTSGLTDGAGQYLSTGGAKTETHPAMNSGSVIPVKLGIASGTTKLVIDIQRLQRYGLFKGQRLGADGSGPQTISIGFACALVEIDARKPNITNTYSVSNGFADLISGTNYTNNDSTVCVTLTESDGGGGTAKATIAASGTDIIITWTMVSWTTAGDNIDYVGIAYEKL